MSDGYTYNLFDGEKPGSTDLVIRTRAGQSLSKEQRSFNRLTKRIAKLQRQITTERDKLDALLAVYGEKVRPLEVTLARQQVELAKRLAASTDRLWYRKRQKEALRTMIVGVCDGAFAIEPPDGETEAFYDQWAETTYQEEVRAQTEEITQTLAEEIRMVFGVDIGGDVDDVHADGSAEGLESFIKQVYEKLQAAEPELHARRRDRKKTAKQLEREEHGRAQEALAKKTMRGIYLSLAKILHPDTIADPEERARRAEFMKQATSAYREGDLCSLLTLELEWATRDRDRLSTLPEATLSLYIRALKDQVAELEQALRRQAIDPRYADIHAIATMAERPARAWLRERIATLEIAILALEADLDLVSSATSKAPIMALVHDYIEATSGERERDELAALIFRELGPLG